VNCSKAVPIGHKVLPLFQNAGCLVFSLSQTSLALTKFISVRQYQQHQIGLIKSILIYLDSTFIWIIDVNILFNKLGQCYRIDLGQN
jgi:hypothetical protein